MRNQLAAGCALLLATACAHSPQPGDAQPRARKVTPPGHPPLPASPAELMEPGSQQKIAQALKKKGLVESENVKGEQLTAAIRRFQGSQGLAETGFPDHETLMRLGIDPKEVDRTLENFSGSTPGEAEVGKGSGGSPPEDSAGKDH